MFTKEIHSPNAPKAIGPYSPAIKLGDFIYISGQLPVNAQDNSMPEDIKGQATQSIKNIQALLHEMNLELRHVVKTTVYMSDLSEFDAMNEVYASFFTAPYPARSCVEVKALPKGAKVEIECFAIDTLLYEQQANQSQCGGGCGGCDGGCDDESGCCCG